MHEFVVAPAAGESAPRAHELKRLENKARVIREPANNLQIDADKLRRVERLQQRKKIFPIREPRRQSLVAAKKFFQLRKIGNAEKRANFPERGGGIEPRARKRICHHLAQSLGRNALEFIDDGEHFHREALVGNADFCEKQKPERAVGKANAKIPFFEPEGAERFHAERDYFGVCGNAGLAENVGIVLVKCAQATALLLFVAIVFADAKPLYRTPQRARAGGDEARERRCHLRPERDFAPALILEIKELGNDFFAGFFCEKLERFEHRRVPFLKRKTVRDLAPC